MIALALDTCDARGSVALLLDGVLTSQASHDVTEDYSSWLIPACNRVLGHSQLSPANVDVYVVACGPGSFTGVRVGLTTVKAWAEVYKKPVVPVSRLEAIAARSGATEGFVAAFTDAHRNQIFGGLFARSAGRLQAVGDEMVLPLEEFVAWVFEKAGSRAVIWASPDTSILEGIQSGNLANAPRLSRTVLPPFAEAIGRLGLEKFRSGVVVDALRLDANYVRRSDAELFSKASGNPTFGPK